MRTYLILLIAVCVYLPFSNTLAQTYFTKDASISFYSQTPLEEIEALNEKAVSILNFDENSIQFSVLMKGFHFKNALMQTHFNENYIESDKYPKASFASTAMDLTNISLTEDGDYVAPVSGILTVRSKEKEISTEAIISVNDGKISGKASFTVSPDDFEIEIPSLVKGKIAKEIEVKVTANYQLYEKS
ncbi:MAG: YceI family protein [Saprospiraceae bacterium]|nr:YceI family protein [Saprospiraceae bacterium]